MPDPHGGPRGLLVELLVIDVDVRGLARSRRGAAVGPFLLGRRRGAAGDFAEPADAPSSAPKLEAALEASTLLDVEEEERQARAAEAWQACETLARRPNMLEVFCEQLSERGFVGSLVTPQLIFLVLVSRLLRRPVSLVLRGTSSVGKSHNVESVLPLFPASAYYGRSGMSERTLVYSDETFRHRIIYIAEADGVAGEGLCAYFLRTLVSETGSFMRSSRRPTTG